MTWKTATKWNQLPAKCGVYAIYAHGELIYIGSSANLYRRFHNGQHTIIRTTYGQENLTFKYKVTDMFIHTERILIRRLHPKLNKIWNNKARKTKRDYNPAVTKPPKDYSRNWYF